MTRPYKPQGTVAPAEALAPTPALIRADKGACTYLGGMSRVLFLELQRAGVMPAPIRFVEGGTKYYRPADLDAAIAKAGLGRAPGHRPSPRAAVQAAAA